MSKPSLKKSIGDLFPKLLGHSIQRKIELTVQRYDLNYFLNASEDEILQAPQEIQPLMIVTDQVFKEHISYDTTAKDKKLSWVFNNMDQEFASEFKEKYENNEFTSVKEATAFAIEIYKVHNAAEYNSSKAVVTSVDGMKVVKKRRLDELNYSNTSYNKAMETLQLLEDNKDRFVNLLKLNKNEVEQRVKEGSFGHKLIGNANTQNQRMLSLFLNELHDIITQNLVEYD